MRKSILKILICIMVSVMLAGCSSGSASKDKTEDNTKEKTEEKKQEDTEKKRKNIKKNDKTADIDLSNEDGILAVLDGEWTLYNREKGEDQGILSIKKDGSFEYKRLDNGAKGSGTLSFDHLRAKESDEPDSFSLKFDDVKDLLPDGYELFGDEGTGGIFHIGSMDGEDDLYLREIGNGDSVVSMYVFNSDEEYDPESWRNEWLFYRKRVGGGTDNEIRNDTFYAFVWESDDNGVWLQPMKEHEYEAYDEYSNRKFLGGYFSETDDIGVTYYEIDNSADISGILHKDSFYNDYPLAMYRVSTDKDGIITEIADVDIAQYNVYDMGELDQDFTFEGTDFIINGVKIDMREYVAATDAVTDCMEVGEWIIVECHINPRKSVYEFFNKTNGLIGCFEYEITGAQLKWRDDDLSTVVYACDNGIYDLWGNMIAYVDEGEIAMLRITGDYTVTATIRVTDEKGRLKEYDKDFEYEPVNGPVLSYYESLLGNERQKRKLINDAPTGAAALIIVNPPESIRDRLPYPETYEENSFDRVVVVSLMDKEKVFIESLEPDSSGKSKRSDVFELDSGESKVFEITVPEGMPSNEVVVRTPGHGEVYWNVEPLSGRIPQMCTYLIAGD